MADFTLGNATFGGIGSTGLARNAATAPYSLGTEFYVTRRTWVRQLGFFRVNNQISGFIRAAIYGATSTISGNILDGTEVSVQIDAGAGATGWVYLTLRQPIALQAGTRYKVVFFFPGGAGNGYPLRENFWTTGAGAQGYVNGPLVVPSKATSYGNAQGSFVQVDRMQFPLSAGTGDYGLDVNVTDTNPFVEAQEGPNWTAYGESGPTLVNTATGALVAGMEFSPTSKCWVYGLRYYRKTTAIAGTVLGRIYRVTNATTGTAVPGTDITFPVDSTTGWVAKVLPTPIELTVGARYRLAFVFPNGRPVTPAWFSTGGGSTNLDVGPLRVFSKANATNQAQGPTATGSTMTYPTTVGADAYWTDLLVTTIDPDPDEPAGALRIWGTTAPAHAQTPTTAAEFPDGLTVGHEFSVSEIIAATGLRIYRPAAATAEDSFSTLYEVQTDSSVPPERQWASEITAARTRTTLPAGAGWTYVGFPVPILLQPGRRYRMAWWGPRAYLTPDYFGPGRPGGTGDVVSGPLRLHGYDSATNAAPLAYLEAGGVNPTGPLYPFRPATSNAWLDISVTRALAGASDAYAPPTGANTIFGTKYFDATQTPWTGVVGSYSNEFAISVESVMYGIRVFRPDLSRYGSPITVRLYADDADAGFDPLNVPHIPGTEVVLPEALSAGWIYVPFPKPVPLITGTRYFVAAFGEIAYIPNFWDRGAGLNGAVNAGAMDVYKSFSHNDNDVFRRPMTASPHQYLIDPVILVDATVPGQEVTAFGESAPAGLIYHDLGAAGGFGTLLGMEFRVMRRVWMTHLRFYRPTNTYPSSGSVTGCLYIVQSNGGLKVVGSDAAFTLSGVGWQRAAVSKPVELVPGTRYRVAIYAPNDDGGRQKAWLTRSYFHTGGPAEFGLVSRDGIIRGPSYYDDKDQAVVTVRSSLGYPSGESFLFEGTGQNAVFFYGSNPWVDRVATTKRPDSVAAFRKPPQLPASYFHIPDGYFFTKGSIYYPQTTVAYLVGGAAKVGSRTVGVEFFVTQPCWFNGYRFQRTRMEPPLLRGNPFGRLYEITSATSGEPVPGSDYTFGDFNDEEWQTGVLDAPVRLWPNKKYKTVIYFPSGFPYNFVLSYYENEASVSRGPMQVPNNRSAVGGSTATFATGNGLTYPTVPCRPAFGEQFHSGIDMLVSERDRPSSPVEYRGFGYRPPGIGLEAQRTQGGLHAGIEFYVTSSTAYFKGFSYYRLGWPRVTQLRRLRLYEVTGPMEGVLVPGTDMIGGLWPDANTEPRSFVEGWIDVPIPEPVKLKRFTRYRIGGWYPDSGPIGFGQGYIASDADKNRPYIKNYFGPGGPLQAGTVNGPLVVPGKFQATHQAQGSYYGFVSGTEYPRNGGVSGDQYDPGGDANGSFHPIDFVIVDASPRQVDGGTVTVVVHQAIGRLNRGVRGGSHTATPGTDVVATSRGRKGVVATAQMNLVVNVGRIAAKGVIDYKLRLAALAAGRKGARGTGQVQLRAAGVETTGMKHVAEIADHDLDIRTASYTAIRWSALDQGLVDIPYPYRADNLRFIAQDIFTRRFLHWDLPLVDPVVTWNLSGPFSISAKLTPAYHDILDLGLDPWSVFIHIEYGGYILGSGILMPWSARGEEFQIEVAGLSSYAQGIPFLGDFSEFFPDPMDVIRAIWKHIQSFPDGNLGLQLPTGRMGAPIYGKAVYDDETGELLGYERWSMLWTDFTDCGQQIDNLARSHPFDYVEVDVWNDTHTDVLHGINFGYPRMGAKRPHLRFVEGENIVEVIGIAEQDDQYASEVFVKGAGEGYSQIYAWVGENIFGRLRRVAILQDQQITTPRVAKGVAIAELIRRVFIGGASQIVIDAFHSNGALGGFSVGDDILIEGMVPWVGEFGLWHRVVSISWAPETGLMTLDVARSETFRYGRIIEYADGTIVDTGHGYNPR